MLRAVAASGAGAAARFPGRADRRIAAAGATVFGIGRGASRGRGRAGRAVSPGRRAAATGERGVSFSLARGTAVLIAGPLGLCFLPAFVCLGIVPVVAALARDLLQSGLL